MVTSDCRAKLGAAIVVVAVVVGSAAGCDSSTRSALDGRRGGDTVVAPTPSASSPPPTRQPVTTAVPPTPSTAATTAVATGPGGTAMRVAWVYDGDTVRAVYQGTSVDVRLFGINAPESEECYGHEATDLLIDRVARRDVDIVEHGYDRYGRLLGTMFADGININVVMVEHGAALVNHGEASAEDPTLLAAQTAAERNELGMWSPTCSAPSPVRIETVNFDAEGSDRANPNGEWIVVVNTGSIDEELSGWSLRDESTGHRFEFPDGFRLAPGRRVTVYSGCGDEAAETTGEPNALFWCSPGGPVWTNAGDSAFLIDADGAIVDVWAWP